MALHEYPPLAGECLVWPPPQRRALGCVPHQVVLRFQLLPGATVGKPSWTGWLDIVASPRGVCSPPASCARGGVWWRRGVVAAAAAAATATAAVARLLCSFARLWVFVF
ncbi:hypothetical protein PLESTM_001191700 [Pleodorina starrii]|nr:hypothetical protein PLESTM_001191700 [Pleodorina starrii]